MRNNLDQVKSRVDGLSGARWSLGRVVGTPNRRNPLASIGCETCALRLIAE
jgi:hypothetical protein